MIKRTVGGILIVLALLTIGLCKNNKREATSQVVDDFLRDFLEAPFKGQYSGDSEWTIPKANFATLTNLMITEAGKLRTRPGVYCYLDSPDTTSNIFGAYEYKKRIESGTNTEIVYQCGDKLYSVQAVPGADYTDISGNISFNINGNPTFTEYFNKLFMANGEENPVVYDQDGNCRYIGYATVTDSCRFTASSRIIDSNTIDFEDYYFYPSMTLTVTNASDANNNGVFEILEVDANVITLSTYDTIVDEAYNEVTLVGFSGPTELIERTERVSTTIYNNNSFYFDYNVVTYVSENFYDKGFRSGMTLVVSNSGANDGTYTILNVGESQSYFYSDDTERTWFCWSGLGATPCSISFIAITTNGFQPFSKETSASVSFVGTTALEWVSIFTPSCLAGHKARLFAAGVKEYPTYLFFTANRIWAEYYYNIWRDRTGYNDGSGYYDVQDKIMALIPEYYDNMVILCENSSWYQRGDDPGFDITTPTQTLIFQLVPISKEIGCVGPNAWCRAGNEIYFWSNQGLQKLSTVEQYGDYKIASISLPINDIHSTLVNNGALSKIKMVFAPELNSILIACGYQGTINDTLIYYNIVSDAFAVWYFTDSKEVNTVFMANAKLIDPNEPNYASINFDPKYTAWIGSKDGKLWALNRNICKDIDYEDVNNPVTHAIESELITSKIKPNKVYIENSFYKMVLFARELINYSQDTYGTFNLYYKTDNDSWSTATAFDFDQYTDTNDSAIDYYEFFPYSIEKTGRSIQYKLTTSHPFGMEISSFMTEYTPIGYGNYTVY